MTYIEAKNIIKSYKTGDTVFNALNNINFNINKGEFVVILGPSGAGKTTLLNLLGGMDYITSGSLIIDNKELFNSDEKKLTLYRRTDVGFVFQFYNLMPNLTAKENIELSNELNPNSLDAITCLENVGLNGKENNFPSQLSGGEQQRVSIARAIAKNPKILLCDEPTGALDINTGIQILKLLKDIAKKENKTVIIVTHNSAIKEMADHVLYIKNGQIFKDEYNLSPKEVEDIIW